MAGSDQQVLSYGRQCLDTDDARAVLEVLQSSWLTQGPVVPEFERGIASQFGPKYAVVSSSGTSALHLTALSLGWGPGDIVIVPAITFLATANCCAYVGAEPFFVDINEENLTIDPNDVERHIKRLRSDGRKVRGIIGVDMAGHPCDWVALRDIANRYEVALVDDACHAMGATYAGGVKVGSCVHPDISVLSFHPVKHITTGEGGAILTNDAVIAEKVARLRNHGTVRTQEEIKNWEGPWHYDMADLGYNYRLTDFQAALGVSQLKKIDQFVARRRAVAAHYSELLNGSCFRLPAQSVDAVHSYHLYIVRTDFAAAGVSRRELFDCSKKKGLLLQVHYRPVFLNSYYLNREINRGASSRLPASQKYYSEAVSLPMFPQLDTDDITRVVSILRSLVG